MPIRLNPYLNFRDNAREAMTFYQEVFGGDLAITTFGDMEASQNPDEDNLVMHALLVTPSGLTVMGSDSPQRIDYRPGNTFSLSLSGDDADELQRCWLQLSEGGTVTIPLDVAPWGDAFGMCMDKFGVSWMVNIEGRGTRSPNASPDPDDN
ncbi:VOC family protein [Pseudarthrobacter sp902506025]|uniref:PhnB protein n=1 Tax=Pseudarthrobacter defluvii TaxID=410837 RepID=A0ABT9UHI6_9MICC|nr:VOC family protein [Pseudarthrobacter defluvii]MDQ0118433.1 PhnB protein [Pseudarthrobacter defluvii]